MIADERSTLRATLRAEIKDKMDAMPWKIQKVEREAEAEIDAVTAVWIEKRAQVEREAEAEIRALMGEWIQAHEW